MKPSAAVAVAACIVAGIGSSLAWSRASQLRDSTVQVIELQAELRNVGSRLAILETAIQEIERSEFGGPFLTGWTPTDGGNRLQLDSPADALYLVVSPHCPWCLPLLRELDDLESSLGGPIILLADDADGIIRFFDSEGIEADYTLVEPSGGWWSIGIPKRVTPLWFRYTDGELTGFGLGAPEVGA